MSPLLQVFNSLHYQALYHYIHLMSSKNAWLLLVPHAVYLQSPFPMNEYHYHLFPSISVGVGWAKRKTHVISPICSNILFQFHYEIIDHSSVFG